MNLLVKKIRRSIGILCKLRHYVDLNILVKLYYALIYPFWGNTYETTLKPIFILQKKAVRIITFSKLGSYSSPLFQSLGLIEFFDIALFQIAILCANFMIMCYRLHSIFVWLTQSVNHAMPSPKIFILAFVTVNRMVVTWFSIVEDRLQSKLG